MDRHEPAPNPLDFTPKYVWRELYQGRWQRLNNVQKIEFAVELVFCILFFGGFACFAYLRNGNLIGFALAFGTVSILLAGFFWLLSRNIRRP
jgi:hypothetical protein